ncbi:MAG TPA: DUF1565 domain-containing protein, partial [Acidobacteriota bacterium]
MRPHDRCHRAVPACVLFLMCSAAAIHPDDLYVDSSTGNDSFPGTRLQPLRTITHALSVSSRDTTIHLAPGIYQRNTGELFPLQLLPGVKLQGEDPSFTVIRAGVESDVLHLPQNTGPFDSIELRGVQIENGSAGIRVDAPDFLSLIILTVHTTIFSNLATAIATRASAGAITDITVLDSSFLDSHTGIYTYGTTGYLGLVRTQSRLHVERSRFSRLRHALDSSIHEGGFTQIALSDILATNVDTAIDLTSTAEDDSPTYGNLHELQITNSTITGGSNIVTGYAYYGGSTTIAIDNSTLRGGGSLISFTYYCGRYCVTPYIDLTCRDTIMSNSTDSALRGINRILLDRCILHSNNN